MRSLFALLLVFAVAHSHAAERGEIQRPLDRAALFYRASATRDLDTLVGLVHSRSFQGHRRYVEIFLLKLEERYGTDALEAVVGTTKGDLDAMDDVAFFRQTIRSAWDLVDIEPAPRPPRIIGELAEGKHVYALVRHEQFLSEDDKRLDYFRNEVLGFAQEGEAWKIVAFPFAPLVAKAWSDELSKAAKPAAP